MECGVSRLPRARGVRSALLIAALAAGALLVPAGTASAGHTDDADPLPIIFVHGGAGSGAQYASVAKRFVTNGYPADRIETYEYNSASPAAIAAAPAGVEALANDLRAEFGVDQVNLVGHSLGTFVSNTFLSNPDRRALVRHYVGVDGSSNTTCRDVWEPDPNENIACMGIWAQPQGARAVGSTNHSFEGEQTHVEAATSAESFAFQYEFFTGEEPTTTQILPEPPGEVEIAGRAVDFPANAGLDGATLEIWEINAATGARKHSQPVASTTLGPSGEWGPVSVNGRQTYEFALQRADSTVQGHLYYQPFIRDDYWVRLLSSPPNAPTVVNTVVGPNHAAAVAIRYREWWSTHPSGRNDVLRISTKSPSQGDQPPVNALQNVTGNGDIGLHIHDNPADGVSSLNVIPFFDAQAFQNGMDVFMPATEPADGTIRFENLPRGDASRPQVLNTPNLASDERRFSVNFNDYVQGINSWAECKKLKPSPCK
jgi:pimeloyl-ACP methyl ester carboxylesterase